MPHLEAALLSVTGHPALSAHVYFGLVTLRGLVSNLVALEAEFFGALEGVVGVFAAEDAVEAGALVRAVPLHVAKLLAVAALDGWIVSQVVASHLLLHFFKFILAPIFLRLCRRCFSVLGFARRFLLELLFEVGVASEQFAAWNDEVRVVSGRKFGNVVFSLILVEFLSGGRCGWTSADPE